jgi:HEAT repeat protein
VTARRNLDDVLLRLREIREAPNTPEATEELRAVIRGRSSHAVAKAAEISGAAELGDLAPDLCAAFERFMKDPIKRDPGCRAKEAIADALQQIDAAEPEVFLAGIHHVQLEPVYGGRQDTAAGLRGAAARGLVRMNHPDAMLLLAELLADPEPPARTAAARAIGYHGGDQGLPLLRLKVLTGDSEIDVLGDCLLAMLQISPGSSIPFVERFLDEEPALAEAAALALGESRAEAALPVLRSWWERTVDPRLAPTALLAIAMLRNDLAMEFLFGLIRQEPASIARHAIAAFEIYRTSDKVVEQVAAAARSREDVDLMPIVEETLG